MKLYTEFDAFYDLLVQQAPVPFVFAIFFAFTLVSQHGEEAKAVPDYTEVAAAASLIWLVSALSLLVLDLLVLPPIFAIMRFGSALVLVD